MFNIFKLLADTVFLNDQRDYFDALAERRQRQFQQEAQPPPTPTADEGRKADDGKDRVDLVPPELVLAVARVLTFGAQKYGDRNWEKGMRWGRVFAGLMRHLWAWWGGVGPTNTSFVFGELDEETKFSHLWHAACCVASLLAYEARKVGQDDRPRRLA